MKNFLSKLLQSKTGAFKDFAQLDAKVVALSERMRVVERLDEKLRKGIAEAQGRFDETPTIVTLEALRDAHTARAGFVQVNFYAKVADSIRYATVAIQRAPESLAIYRICLCAIRDGLKDQLDETRAKLQAAFEAAGDDRPALDNVPAVQKITFQIAQIDDLEKWLDWQGNFDDQVLMRILAVIRGALPEPPAPKVIPPTMEERHKAEVLARLGATSEAPAPATEPVQAERHTLLPEAWKHGPVDAARHAQQGHRI